MFWRFGFHNASSIDSLLDRDDVALEDILDEDELLQECKAQNTRLIDYFQRSDVLQRMFGYVAGSIEGEEKGRFKYPYVATEVLCSEIWSIVEACVTNSEQLLAPFWETVLDRSPDDMKTRSSMAAHFAKINGVFMNKKPTEMLAFIRSQPFVVERLIMHIETPAIVDLLFRIIQLDEYPTGAGVLEWLTSEKLIPRLIDLLSPTKSPEIHLIVADILKGIITMSAPSPGASALNESSQHIPACNRFARELVSRESITKLLRFMLDDVPLTADVSTGANGHDTELSRTNDASTDTSDSEDGDDRNERDGLPTAASATSSLINSISVVIELIRKNNSDYFEPYLFHNLRNRLIQVQQQLHMQSEDNREVLEQTMKELVDRMGVVHLGTMLECFCERLDSFHELLKHPRSLNGPLSTTVGQITPLTLERFRICELYAELLHCSNMALLNRPLGTGPTYDDDGRLQGGLSALEELARVISTGAGETNVPEDVAADSQDVVEAKELPVHSISSLSTRSTDSSSLASDSDSELSDHSSDDALDEIAVSDHPDPPFPIRTRSREMLHIPVPSTSEPSSSSTPPLELNASNHSLDDSQTFSVAESNLDSTPDVQTTKSSQTLPVGDTLKQRFMNIEVLGTLLDLFFQFPWNNFLHGTVYDLVHQVLTGRIDSGLNRVLIVSLFHDAKLLHRIVEGHNVNDKQSQEPKSVRMGYMGHLTLISEDIITALEHYPEDLTAELLASAPQPGWDNYVNGGYKETKKRDTSLLGGGKPVISSGAAFQKRWTKVDEEDSGPINGSIGKAEAIGAVVATSALQGEFRRSTSSSPPRNTADFGPSQEEEEATPSQFARYLAEEIHGTPAASPFTTSSYSDASDDDEDEDGGWLARSAPFDFTPPAVTPQAVSPFDDPFNPSSVSQPSTTTAVGFSDNFGDEDDGFGPFSESAVSSDGFALDQDDSQFDFGDFQTAEGDFQTSEEPSDGEMTPTGGSWTIESGADVPSSLSDSTFSFEESNEELKELNEQLESTTLDENSLGVGSQSKHTRTASTG